MTTTKADKVQSTTVPAGKDQGSGRVKAHPPVFIFEVLQGCGSGLLADLLLSYPSLQAPATLQEDYLMEHAHLLLQYVDKTYVRWKGLPWIEKPEEWRDTLLHGLSDGIRELFMSQAGDDRRLLIRTTATNNLDKFVQFFPEAKLLILTRDGRDAVEATAVQRPGESYELRMQQWAEGARAVLNLMQSSGDTRGKSWELVKYEDLVERPAAIVAGLSNFLELDSASLDSDRIERLRVRGLSEKSDEKSAGRNRLGKWDQWGWFRKRAFKRIAGEELISFGYAPHNSW